MNDARYAHFPSNFFHRQDPTNDRWFYTQPRIVTHIDDGARAAIGSLYEQLSIEGDVLDLMGSWISHFTCQPKRLVVHGMNPVELAQNMQACGGVVADLNAHPSLPFRARVFDGIVCAVSVDYLQHPLEVFDEIGRVLRPGGRAVVCFSNRLFPTKAIRGWLAASDEQRIGIVAGYFSLSAGWGEPSGVEVPTSGRDPLFAVWADRVSSTVS
jgi:SAM-dependent methyltransferase